MTRITMMALASGLALTGAVFAQDTAKIDANEDGMFSMEELLVAYPTLTEETYLTMDSDADGLINDEEFATAIGQGLLPAADEG
ncbi:EF-hand domain-containing protein [Actibacterium sp. D379-3]